MKNSSLISKSLIAISILASCEKDPIDEIQDDYLYEMMTQEEILVEETKTVETSTQSSTIELTNTTTSTLEIESTTSTETIEITQVESTTVELTSTDSTTVEITSVATETVVVENNNNDSNDDSNESNDSDNTESNNSDSTPVVAAPAQPVVSQVVTPVAVVNNTPQPIVVNATDLDYNNFDVNAQDIVVFNGVEYSSEDFKSIVDSHVANVAAQQQANEAQIAANNNIQAQHDAAQAEAEAQAQAQAEADAAAIAAQANNDVLTEVVEVVGTATWKVNGINILLHNSKITNQDGVHYSTTIEVPSGQNYELFALILHEGGINYHNGDTLTYKAGATATLAVKVNGVGKTKDIIL